MGYAAMGFSFIHYNGAEVMSFSHHTSESSEKPHKRRLPSLLDETCDCLVAPFICNHLYTAYTGQLSYTRGLSQMLMQRVSKDVGCSGAALSLCPLERTQLTSSTSQTAVYQGRILCVHFSCNPFLVFFEMEINEQME